MIPALIRSGAVLGAGWNSALARHQLRRAVASGAPRSLPPSAAAAEISGDEQANRDMRMDRGLRC